MGLRNIHHSRWLAVLIVLVVIGVGLYTYGVDWTSLRIAWYRIRLLSDDPEVGIAQVDRLAALGDRGTRHLTWWCVLHDVDEVQVAAITVLRDRREMSACPALIRALDDNAPSVRDAANEALEHLSGESMGFNPYAAWANRRDEVRRWEEWWATRRFSRPVAGPVRSPAPAGDVASDAGRQD